MIRCPRCKRRATSVAIATSRLLTGKLGPLYQHERGGTEMTTESAQEQVRTKRMVATFDVPVDYDKHDLADLLPRAFREWHEPNPTVWEWPEFWADARDGVVGPDGDTTARVQ